AQFLKMANTIGTIQDGEAADLVVVRGNLNRRISDIEHVETVFKDGVGWDSAKLIQSVRGQVGVH
ncbi:MAG: amidohydrolase family protein, partial [Terriglobales bacterium]